MQIYVGNLSFNITEDELREVFAEHGEVEVCQDDEGFEQGHG